MRTRAERAGRITSGEAAAPLYGRGAEQSGAKRPYNGKLHPRGECVKITFDRKLPESAFPLRQQAAKRRRVEAMLGAVLRFEGHQSIPEVILVSLLKDQGVVYRIAS